MKNYVVVTTDKKGVFWGELVKDESPKKCILKNAKMCLYWTIKTQGVLGLANIGPQKGSRLTPPVPQIVLYDITAIIKCTPEATKQWSETQ
jgi:hypothetical protein